MNHWTDDDAADRAWHLCRVREPARAMRELTGLLSGGTIGLPDPESIRFKPVVAAVFEPTEVKTVPVKKRGVIVRSVGRGNRAKLKHIQRPLFAGYWFVSPVLGADWQAVERAEGIIDVIRIAGSPDRAWQAKSSAMRLLFDRERGVLRKAATKAIGAGGNFNQGQDVVIVDGPFRELNAIVSAVDKSGRVALLIEMFGQESTVYVDAADLKAA